MIEENNDLIIYKFNVEWKIYDSVGNELLRRSKPFETKAKAEEFVIKLKQETPQKHNLLVLIRELENQEIVRRYKKKSGNKNYRRS